MDKKKKVMCPIPSIKRGIWLLLKEYCLRKTREEERLVTLGETIEKAILNLTDSEMKKNKKYKED